MGKQLDDGYVEDSSSLEWCDHHRRHLVREVRVQRPLCNHRPQVLDRISALYGCCDYEIYELTMSGSSHWRVALRWAMWLSSLDGIWGAAGVRDVATLKII